jgi:hypothetical protein
MQKVVLILAFMTVAATSDSQKVRVVGNSRLAKIIACINGEKSYAITFGHTVFVSCTKEDFFAKKWWVKHEFAHVTQYEKHGVLGFLSLYLYYNAFHHKSVNPLEREAEIAERATE